MSQFAPVFDRTRPAGEISENRLQLNAVLPFLDMSPTFAESLREIQKLMRLPQNWDTYGSSPVQHAAVEKAVLVLAAAEKEEAPAPRIVPVPGGGLQLEWSESSRELEVELLPDGSIEVLAVQGDRMNEGRLREGQIFVLVPLLLRWLSGDGNYAASGR